MADPRCLNCGKPFEAGGTGFGRKYCPGPCRRERDARNRSEGGPMNQLVKAWTATRHAPPGSREAKVCAYARREITQIASLHNEEDVAENRTSAIAYVEALMANKTMFVDRRRKK